ncbi:sigma 54-interacting transcriptional regulator [Methylobacterium sp. Leaf89]|uniref:sigma-54 interaction domain-containing protein n=1 Tax=Methylobacterium sp. Leaf89 TaxID=1736245 RepID=UPI0006FB3CB7|nr:sigma 54-interacting transcriptional regulator [Methylobacterium sp. Leaf89]KQO69177.1 Fis family transcriptional regulator [Methylobacterium sp. Leaf89]
MSPLLAWPSAGTDDAQMLRLLLDHVSDCLVAVDGAGMIVLINRPYCTLLGGSEEDFLRRHITEVIGPQTRLHLVAQGDKPMSPYPLEVRGQKLLARQVPVLKDGKPVGAIGIALFSSPSALRRAYQRFESAVAVQAPTATWRAKFDLRDIVGNDPAMEECRSRLRRAAETDFPVLIDGETGTGKELAAHALHAASSRSGGPFVSVNCASIPAELIDSELFGYEGGAFTGAASAGKVGKVELASGGTLFLDEIGDMPLRLQGSLLRVLQTGEIVRVGGTRPIPVDFRLACATHRTLEDRLAAGAFRSDLFYRVAVLRVRMPALRERADLTMLVGALLGRICETSGATARELTTMQMDRLRSHQWPGNVRELESVLSRYLVMGEIEISKIPGAGPVVEEAPTGNLKALTDRQRAQVAEEELGKAGGDVEEAARRLGISRSQFYRIRSTGRRTHPG